MVGNDNNIKVEFAPYNIIDVFLSPDEKKRKTPYALYYPTHRKHQITVKLPRRWNLTNERQTITSKSFDFSLQTKMNSSRNILYINYEYQNKGSYVKPEDFGEYYKKIKEAEQIMSYYIYVPKDNAGNNNFSFSDLDEDTVSNIATLFYWIFGIAGVIIVGLVAYAIGSNRSNK
ncbi:hypothetical protein MHTCC0001_04770 [Flavobacteriaceae bacterium MHTCC 0001]